MYVIRGYSFNYTNILKLFGQYILIMREKTLFKIALISAILGIILLFILSQQEEKKTIVKSMEEASGQKSVKVQGQITKLTDKEKVAFMEILWEKPETVEVVLFKDKNLSLQQGDYVEIEGTIEEYKGKKEIIGSKVVLK